MINKFRSPKKPIYRQLLELFLLFRALLFIGIRYTCPCCGWRLRTFTHGGTSFKVRHLGHCPRCNSKARHRRDWLYLKQKTNLFEDSLCLLHVSPQYSLSRRFRTLHNLKYVAVDLYDRANICVKMDLSAASMADDIFDAIICIHVLEHIQNDIRAIQELFRVLKPGGWALISVPIRLDQKTFEDPTITVPAERKIAFGETNHFRFYGYDLLDRLKACGFEVQLDLGQDIEQLPREKYGLLNDENIFYCTKPYSKRVAYKRVPETANDVMDI